MVRINGCPMDFATPVFPLVQIMDLFNKGLPPISGGTLDQSASFLSAVKFFQQEEASLKHE